MHFNKIRFSLFVINNLLWWLHYASLSSPPMPLYAPLKGLLKNGLPMKQVVFITCLILVIDPPNYYLPRPLQSCYKKAKNARSMHTKKEKSILCDLSPWGVVITTPLTLKIFIAIPLYHTPQSFTCLPRLPRYTQTPFLTTTLKTTVIHHEQPFRRLAKARLSVMGHRRLNKNDDENADSLNRPKKVTYYQGLRERRVGFLGTHSGTNMILLN